MKQYCEATTLLDQNRTKVLSLFLQVEPHSSAMSIQISVFKHVYLMIGKGAKKKTEKVWSFAKLGGSLRR